jgi:predicted HTH transcriptional regulator
MTRDRLLHLIAQGEGQRLEFKRSLAELEDSVCSVAAFANAEGGTLLFGVRADGTVIGVTLTTGKYAQLFGVDRRTAQRDLGKLVVKGQARRIGQGASTAYQSA